MDFSSERHEQAYERIKAMMVELFGETGATAHDKRPGWMVPRGSAILHLSVVPWRGGEMHMVQLVSYVTQGTEVTPAFMRYLLEENHTMVYGAFAIDSDGDTAFNHTVNAETIGKDDLKTIIMAVNSTADSYDDVITQRWGGKRADD